MIKKSYITILILIIFFPIKSHSLIEVDITRGNLNPLPIAVSPLSLDESSKKKFYEITEIENLGQEIALVVSIPTTSSISFLVFSMSEAGKSILFKIGITSCFISSA